VSIIITIIARKLTERLKTNRESIVTANHHFVTIYIPFRLCQVT